MQVYDEVVKALTARRFAVILNNHTNKSRWCCGANDGNERWNASQDEESWIQDWVAMVTRYKDNKFVAGADLYNEVRRYVTLSRWRKSRADVSLSSLRTILDGALHDHVQILDHADV